MMMATNTATDATSETPSNENNMNTSGTINSDEMSRDMEDKDDDAKMHRHDHTAHHHHHHRHQDALSSSAFRIDSHDDDVLLHILSYLDFHSLCKISKINRRFYYLISYNNNWLWKDICVREFWPCMKKKKKYSNYSIIIEEENIPSLQRKHSTIYSAPDYAETTTTTKSATVSANASTNFPLLLSMASVPEEPTGINESMIIENIYLREIECVTRNDKSSSSSKAQQQQEEEETGEEIKAYRFTGQVGPGQRCIRSDHPLQRPKLIPHFLDIDALIGSTGAGTRRGNMVPFVAPIFKENEIHLKPRLIAYFEISMTRDPATATTTHTTHRNRFQPFFQECTAIGLATENWNDFDYGHKMPGWDRYSYGYHGDDGGLYHNTSFGPFFNGGNGERRLPTYGTGDVVGCGIDYVEKSIFFTLNGRFLGYHFDLSTNVNFYPIVGMDSHCLVSCNFGQSPFVFDLEAMTRKDHAVVEDLIRRLPHRSDIKNDYVFDSDSASDSSSSSNDDDDDDYGGVPDDDDDDDTDTSNGSSEHDSDDESDVRTQATMSTENTGNNSDRSAADNERPNIMLGD